MAEPAISFAVQTIGNLLTEEAKFLQGVKDQVEQLQTELKQMQWLLKDADEKMSEGERIKQWILQVKDMAYDAEDLVEKFAIRVGSRREGGFVQVLNRCVCILNDCHQVGSEIQALTTKISSLKNSFQAYGIRAIMEKEGGSSSRQQQLNLRRAYSFVEEEDFVGLESDVDMLAKHLVNENEHFRVVSISGMGGSGKTTLAKKVYKHPNVKRYFEGFAWISVSQQWQTKDILQRIMIKLEPEKREQIEKQWREDELIKNLLNVQQRRKCLIVLDDIWTTDAWESIKEAFPTGNYKGSKILVTTRNREVALHIGPDGFHHQPRFLSEDESWELLQRKALRERYERGHHMNTNLKELEELGKKMLKCCGGLPLAVVVLGGILSTKNTLSEWEMVHQDVKSHLWKEKTFGKGKGDLEKILALSYYDLPFEMKPLFLYLGSFPEDANIDPNNLYQLWMAEGMVLTKDRVGQESMMELAERCLGELGQRGMVQLLTSELPGITRFKSCRVHDVIRDFCLLEAEQQSFLKSINYSSKGKGKDVETFDPLSASSICKLRRFVINLEAKDVISYNFPKKELTKYLRMLRFAVSGFRGERAKLHLNNFEMLRSLSIEGFFIQRNDLEKCCWSCTICCCCSSGLKLAKQIGKVIHLRYLSLRRSYFAVLPTSLGNLKRLQTLDLRLHNSPRLPNILWKMKELTCLYLPYGVKKQWCRIRLHGLEKLEILENFSDTDCETEDLLPLTSLRVLSVQQCINLENLKMIANYAESNNRLEHVSICTYCDFNLDREEGLRILKQLLFGRNIHCLTTRGTIWKFPEYGPNMSSNLVRLALYGCGLDVEGGILRTLEKFCHLRELILSNLKGKEMSFHAMGFPQLRQLRLYNFKELEKWVVEEGAMPNLRLLDLRSFRALEAIPDGLRFITTLEEFHIGRGSDPKLIERIWAPDNLEGEDFYKISHVPLIRKY